MNLVSQIAIGALGSLIASTLVAILLIKVFRRPDLSLHYEYIKRIEVRNPAIYLSVDNRKWYVGFGGSDVVFGLFLPEEIKNSYFGLITTEGIKDWHHEKREMRVFEVENIFYNQYRGVIHLPVHPTSRTHFLSIVGDFPRNKKIKIFYYFRTPYGNTPRHLKFGNIVKNLEDKKLPYIEFITD